MPVTALPPSNTARYFLDYVIASGEARSLQLRLANTGLAGDAADWCENMLTQVASSLGTGWAVTGARVAAAGSDVTLPAAAPASPSPGGGALVAALYPQFIAAQGRSPTSGRKVRLSLYGLVLNTQGDYRFQVGENTDVDAFLLAVNALPTGVGLCIDGSTPTWYDYANQGLNVYHQRQRRG